MIESSPHRLLNERLPVPYAGSTVIVLAPAHFDLIKRTIETCFRLAHSPAWAARVDVESSIDPITHIAPGNTGVFMGYDFHITAAGPRLIEINTNAGGALLNGIHTLSLCNPEKLACLCQGLLPVEAVRERVLQTLVEEFEAVRGRGSRPQRIAIADERPREQFLHSEFELIAHGLTELGLPTTICDTGELVATADGLTLHGQPIDLVYLRDTDFLLTTARAAHVRRALEAGTVVVTPLPREHHLLANKRRLCLLSSLEALHGLGLDEEEAHLLATVVPETRRLDDLGPERAWAERRQWVFKPEAAFGSRAVYRGDKITRGRFDEIVHDPDYVAQRRVEPGIVAVDTTEGAREMKFDVRAYAYRDEVLLLGARVYQGQVTNLRSPGGGFSAICVARND